MKAKAIALFAALLLSVIQSMMFLGCSHDADNAVSSQKEDAKELPRIPGEGNQWPSTDENSVSMAQSSDSGSYFMTLDNGMKIYFISKSIKADSLCFRFRYQTNDGLSAERILKMSSLTGVSICRTDGADLFHYDFNMQDTNQVLMSAGNTIDTLQVLFEQTDAKVSAAFTINGNRQSIEFSNKEEAIRAKELYLAYKESSQPRGFTDNDQQLIEKMSQMEEFLNLPISFANNADAEVAMNLMGDPEFLRWTVDNNQQVLAPCDRKCICAIASLISIISCTFSWTVVGAVICIISAGIALACAIADIIDSFISIRTDYPELPYYKFITRC